ncbi:transposase [Aerococcaceae bacterium DSM 111020]|nr:transposase [Aerococcaceae bacterium DSM 111020]
MRQLEAWGNHWHPKPTTLPVHLAIDECQFVKSVKHAMSCIQMDNHKHPIIDILEDRTQAALRAYFQCFSRKERLKVQTITIDMYSPYRDFLPRLFPNAIIIIDRFHIVQLLHRAVNNYRINVMKRLKTKQQRDYRKLKK